VTQAIATRTPVLNATMGFAARVSRDPLWLLVNAVPWLGPEGEVQQVLCTLSDITERRRAEEATRDLAGQLLTAHEEERRWLARELHDDVSQRLAVLAIGIGSLAHRVPADLTSLHIQLQALQDQIAILSTDVHGLSRQLHPAILEDLGLVDAIATECCRFSERQGVSVIFTPQDVPQGLPQPVALCLYRVVREGLHNIAKHARATDVQVVLASADDGVRLTIRDNGVGFDPSRRTGGLGLASMQERLRLIRGRLAIHTRPGRGVLIDVWAPVARREP
jgi:signal transduction histidine kinase